MRLFKSAGMGGRPIEVETTSKRGYDQVHDKEFFENSFAAFSLKRDLAVPTYEDYLKRRVVPPYQLIGRNMNNQHTDPSSMDKSTRYRLFEIQGYLDPDSASSQLNRLSAFHNSMAALLNTRSFGRALALTEVFVPILGHVASRSWIQQTKDKDVHAIWERASAIHTMWGHVLLKQKRHQYAERHFTEALRWSRTTALKTEARKGLLNSRGERAFEGRQWQQAIEAYEKMRSMINASDRQQRLQTRKTIATAYWNWGTAAREQSRWLEAAQRYEMVVKTSQDSAIIQNARGDRAISKHNIGATYMKWGNTLFQGRKFQLAL